MRLLRFLAVVLAATTVASCADLKDIVTLASQLQERYHVDANVKVTNGSHLYIDVQNAAAAAKLDSTGKAELARDIAAFAKAHYPRGGQLEDVSVAFSSVSHTGPITVARFGTPYSFAASELK